MRTSPSSSASSAGLGFSGGGGGGPRRGRHGRGGRGSGGWRRDGLRRRRLCGSGRWRGGRRGLLRGGQGRRQRQAHDQARRARHRGCSGPDQSAAIPITWKPPSTWMTSPVTPRDSGETRNSADVAHLVLLGVLAQGGMVAMVLQHLREPVHAGGGQGLDGAGGDRVDADAARAEVRGQVAHRGLERGLGHAHHVVVRHHALAAEVAQGHDAAARPSMRGATRRARAVSE